MNYELAQKLYKAGFPGIACSEESPVPGYSYPNLSELIGACIEPFKKSKDETTMSLYTNYRVNYTIAFEEERIGEYTWTARIRTEQVPHDCNCDLCEEDGDDDECLHANGDYPEEAVANLWLKLSSGVSESTSPTNL